MWRTYFEWLGQAAASGMFDILAHPDLVKYWGAPERPWPEGDLRRFYEIAMEAIAASGIAVEVSTAGLRKPVGELYPARALLEMVVEAGNPIALSSDAHAPEDLGRDYDQALAAARRARRGGAGGLRTARAASGADRMTTVDGHRLGLAPARAPGAR